VIVFCGCGICGFLGVVTLWFSEVLIFGISVGFRDLGNFVNLMFSFSWACDSPVLVFGYVVFALV